MNIGTGGAPSIRHVPGSGLFINGCNFTSNTADTGGAVRIDSTNMLSGIVTTQNVFTSNVALVMAGAIEAIGRDQLSI